MLVREDIINTNIEENSDFNPILENEINIWDLYEGKVDVNNHTPSEFIIKTVNTFGNATFGFNKEKVLNLDSFRAYRKLSVIITAYIYDNYKNSVNFNRIQELNNIADIIDDGLDSLYASDDGLKITAYTLQIKNLDLNGIEDFRLSDLFIILTEVAGLTRALFIIRALMKDD